MGIKDLSTIFYESNAQLSLPLLKLCGTRVAVDCGSILYPNWQVAVQQACNTNGIDLVDEDPNYEIIRNHFIAISIRKLLTFLSNGIHPICIFDGTAPPEKYETHQKRKKSEESRYEKFYRLRAEGQNLPPLSPQKQSYHKEMMKYVSSVYPKTREDDEWTMQQLSLLGFPVIKAKCEADGLCASLEINGFVSTVLTSDTDILCYGVKGFIRDLTDRRASLVDSEGNNYSSKLCQYVDLDTILQANGFDFNMFRDFCIMLGCDYNERIYRVGFKKSLTQILNHGSIDNLKLNTEPLNHHRCREIFSNVDLADNIDYDNSIKVQESSPLVDDTEVDNIKLRFDFNWTQANNCSKSENVEIDSDLCREVSSKSSYMLQLVQSLNPEELVLSGSD